MALRFRVLGCASVLLLMACGDSGPSREVDAVVTADAASQPDQDAAGKHQGLVTFENPDRMLP